MIAAADAGDFMPDKAGFDAVYARGEAQVVWTRVIDDLETPVSAYLKIGRGREYACLFESVEGGAWRGRYSILALDPDLVWRAHGDRAEVAEGDAIIHGAFEPCREPALASLRAVVQAAKIDLPQALPPMAAGVFGVLGYDMVRLVEPLSVPNPDPLDLPDAVMIRPRIVAIFDGVRQEIVLVAAARPQVGVDATRAYADACARLEQVRSDLAAALPATGDAPTRRSSAALASQVGRADYAGMVTKAKAYITDGDIFQVVPSRRFSAPYPGDPFAFYRALRRLNPSPFLYFLELGGVQLAGSSPEILVRWRDGCVTIRPIAGTRPRGATPDADLALERELLADPKERAEHLMLLDLGRNDVARAMRLGEDPPEPACEQADGASAFPRVDVTQSFAIERYSHVMHIVSNVEGRTSRVLDPVEVILTALPAGTLSGAPKVRAMQIIDELEAVKRGIGYGGAAGYISATGEVDTCIVLRTALFKDGVVYTQAGGGIVADSDADAEFDETTHKAEALARALAESWRFEV